MKLRSAYRNHLCARSECIGQKERDNMGQLDNKVALVTGSGRGLGRACAQIFAREGANVVVVDINRENGEETVGLIKQAGRDAIFVEADVSRSEDVQRMVRAAVENFGGVDCGV